ncbi:MAG: glucose-6-phosphate dehydrogenase [Chloroflexi bacterium]|nr:glucose-6-phosphate dehydrogenase [Chloroflexota bacterium]MCH7654941.1 glucose-6-phosphate dehydrogenase [Chloroflexota bacterium]
MSSVTTIVIIGGTGDLAQRKLLPALVRLAAKGRLPENLAVIGFARAQHDDASYRELMWSGAHEHGDPPVERPAWDAFAPRLSYVCADLADPASFDTLRGRLEAIEAGAERVDRLFYLAISPALFAPAIAGLEAAGLAREEKGWRRVVVEKPFGHDEESAAELDRRIHAVFGESQVYRIDHYLGKETVQNLLVFRFANAIFEPLWNRNYIDNVQITASEEVTVGDRAGYYDSSGVVRDMVQNHLLQLLCLVAMEPPSSQNAESLRSKRVEVLDAVRRWSPKEFAKNAVAGQYDGYLDERGVAPDSRTPTYAAMRLFIDNWRWQGVPFYLRSGKAMAGKRSEIAIQFKAPPLTIFAHQGSQDPAPNVLAMCVGPDGGFHLRFSTKVPDQAMLIESAHMEFHYRTSFAGHEIPEAYQRLLEDALAGDASLFIRSDQIAQAWSIVDPLLRCWADPASPKLERYATGSWGPAAADELLAQDGFAWQSLCGHDE